MRYADAVRFWRRHAAGDPRRRGKWYRPVARVKASLRASRRWIAASKLVREANDEETASLLLLKALAPLAEAGETLRRMCRRAALTPERAADASIKIQQLNVALIEVEDQIIVSTFSFDRQPEVVEQIRAIALPDVRVIRNERPVNPVRLFLARDISRAMMRRFLAGTRRRRFVPSRIADAPRRVSRGRAPPALALCPL